jgi:hypothetical protein
MPKTAGLFAKNYVVPAEGGFALHIEDRAAGMIVAAIGSYMLADGQCYRAPGQSYVFPTLPPVLLRFTPPFRLQRRSQ